ncbi:MAG: DCC1-like thiol-disulfide oxidoreductase family protein [Polyangiaceae bacterium]
MTAQSSSSSRRRALPFWLAAIRHVSRLDARSLGLFRIAFGGVLIADLLARARYLVEFYTNEGVLANHTHLNGLKQDAKSVWSAFHAFNTSGEAKFGMAVVFFIYLCFMLGWKTRAFHVLSLVSLVSLGTRNLLTESWANWVGVSILAFTVALPLGSRFGIDAFLKGSRDATEMDADDLNHRTAANEVDIDQHRVPGWSPMSIAAVGFLVQIAVIYICLAQNQADAWKDGTALDKLLHVKRLASPFGLLKGSEHPAIYATLTKAIYWLQYVIPILLVIPILRGTTRGLAAFGMLVHGVFLGLFFNLGMFGWALAASSFAILSSDMWDGWMNAFNPKRARTVIYDADCGICFWLAKLLKRLDTGRHLTFQGNDSVFEADPEIDAEGTYDIVSPSGERSKRPLPETVTRDLVEQTIVVIDANGQVTTKGAAIVAILQALPGFRLLGAIAPVALLDFIYGIVAPRRTKISVACGLSACGTVKKPSMHVAEAVEVPLAPSTRLRHIVTSSIREGYAILILVAMLAQTHAENPKFPSLVPSNGALANVTWYMRMIDRWDVLAQIPAEQGVLVVDAVAQDNTTIDTFTGKPPVVDFDVPFELGQLWSDYLYRIVQDPKYQDPKYQGYVQAFKTYLQKAGPRWSTEQKEKKIVGLDAYWYSTSVPANGETKRTQVARIGRGGQVLSDPSQGTSPSMPQLQNPSPLPAGPTPMLRPRPAE